MRNVQVARERAEEANSFARHEVKNGVLAAITICDSLSASLSSELIEVEKAESYTTQLQTLNSTLNQTLETCLSHTLASEIINDVYIASTTPVNIEQLLRRVLLTASGEPESYPISFHPMPFPLVETDGWLLRQIFRNALSNASKYGKRNGLISTKVEHADDSLILHVINEPGKMHDILMTLNADRIFEKGRRFHEHNPCAGVSKGDGAWIMKKCAECLQGQCSIVFGPEQTVFELKIPAPSRPPDSDLEGVKISDAWAVGVDDCEFQRTVLQQLFIKLGFDESRILMLGETRDEIEHLSDRLVEIFEYIPPTAKLLAIIDENLDLPAPSMDAVSGSKSLVKARASLVASQEARMLALIRSANDSAKDVSVYRARAHGALPKAPIEPPHKTVMRAWLERFGSGSHVLADPDSNSSAPRTVAQELEHMLACLSRDYSESLSMTPWIELKKWLHRVKGMVQTNEGFALTAHSVEVCSGARSIGNDAHGIISSIDLLRALNEEESGRISVQWTETYDQLRSYLVKLKSQSCSQTQ